MKPEFKIVRKLGYDLNPDDQVVNEIIHKLDQNGGHCPSKHPERVGHDFCPCSEWLTNNRCFCGLYVKLSDLKLEHE